MNDMKEEDAYLIRPDGSIMKCRRVYLPNREIREPNGKGTIKKSELIKAIKKVKNDK